MVVQTIEKGVFKRIEQIERDIKLIHSITAKRISTLEVASNLKKDVHIVLQKEATRLTDLKRTYLDALTEKKDKDAELLIKYLNEVIDLEEKLYGKLLAEEVKLVKKIHAADKEIKKDTGEILEEITQIISSVKDQTVKPRLEQFKQKCALIHENELKFDHAIDEPTLALCSSLWKDQRKRIDALKVALNNKDEREIKRNKAKK